ncbi:unnamed protein product [Menidia menidia]|uniref:(Atlantic silverside) hypothetical protein n=1 Tax=Menidia menidia TaxID=238744 RepID=A0A8S4BNU0_9TELE|nr:unnamed protein product [Menidia menidia]
MMRLLFLCLLLLLPASADTDDEDLIGKLGVHETNADKTKGTDEASNQITMIVIIVAVTVLTLSVAAIVAVMLARRQMNIRQQGIYSVPTEQDQKGAI